MTNIFKEVSAIIGEPLYLVGGSVRDILLNKEPKDYDFTSPLQPNEIEKRIKNDFSYGWVEIKFKKSAPSIKNTYPSKWDL